MPAERFIDTNILLYGYDRDAGEKHKIAQAILSEGWEQLGCTAISVQVLQEFFVNAMRQGQSQDVVVKLLVVYCIAFVAGSGGEIVML